MNKDFRIPVEVKATDGATASLNKLIDSDKYGDIKYGIKLGNRNIGYNGHLSVFPDIFAETFFEGAHMMRLPFSRYRHKNSPNTKQHNTVDIPRKTWYDKSGDRNYIERF